MLILSQRIDFVESHDVRDIAVREDIRVHNLNLYTTPCAGVAFAPLTHELCKITIEMFSENLK